MASEFRTESRSVELRDAEVKGREFRGYAAVFDTPWSKRLIEATGYIEKVSRGVFRKVLANNPDVPLLIGHEGRNMPLATTSGGTLKLQEDNKGLVATATLPDNHIGEYARTMIERGDIRGMSYGISLDPKRDTLLTRSEKGVYTRTVARISQLLDVSLTWEPAYSATSVELRAAGFVATPLEEILSGEEPQTEEAPAVEPPGEGKTETWWDGSLADDLVEPTEPATERKWWEVLADEYEREV